MNGWQPIETAPKSGVRILVWVTPAKATPKVGIAHWHQPGNKDRPGFWTTEGFSSRKITHWRPLPEPPHGKIEEEKDGKNNRTKGGGMSLVEGLTILALSFVGGFTGAVVIHLLMQCTQAMSVQ
jgi:hypothetical protein